MWTKNSPQPGHGFYPRGPTPLLGTPRYPPPLLGPRGPRAPPPQHSQIYPPQPYYRGGGPGRVRPIRLSSGSPRSLIEQPNSNYNEFGNNYGPQPLMGGYGVRPPLGLSFLSGAGRVQSAGKKRKRGAGAGTTATTTDDYDRAKVLKKDKAFFCDTCDRGFDTRDMLDEHYGTHSHCDRPGCRFEAHPKIVELHVKMQHETGFAEKIMSLDSAEQIEKWRNERKKNFPSAEGIAKRQAEQEAMISRGELLTNLAYFSPHSKRGQQQQQQRGGLNMSGRGRGGRGGVTRGHSAGPPYRPLMSLDYDSYPPPLIRGRGWGPRGARSRFPGGGRNRGFKSTAPTRKPGSTLGKFGGTAKPLPTATEESKVDEVIVKVESMDTSDHQITDSEGEVCNSGVTSSIRTDGVSRGCDSQSAVVVPKALLGLMNAYQSETEPEQDDKESQPGPSTVQSSTAASTNPTRQRGGSGSKPAQRPGFVRHPQKKRIGLLERLLANEIRHERNVILQCVHYVVKENFFGVGQPRKTPTGDSVEQSPSGQLLESLAPPSSDLPADSLEQASSDQPMDSLELSFELPADSLEQSSAEKVADDPGQLHVELMAKSLDVCSELPADSLEQLTCSEIPVDSLDQPYYDPLANSLEQLSFELPDDSLEQSYCEAKDSVT